MPHSDPLLANAPRGRGFGIDDVLVEHVQPTRGDVVVDLGCGSGFTLAAAAPRVPEGVLVGMDRDQEALKAAAAVGRERTAALWLIRADLAQRLPLKSESVTRLLCHNVLEQLPDPEALLLEGSRVLRSRGRSVWSHPDYDSVVISGGDVDLTRRIVHLFADLADPTMDHADGQMGRKLPGLIRRSPLVPVTVTSNVLISTELAGPARFRVDATVAALDAAARAGRVDLTSEELAAWMATLEAADRNGEFLYSHITYIVVADKP